MKLTNPIGGNCADCQARIKNEDLKDERELQAYFIRRIEKIVNAHGKNLIGWSEIREGGLAPSAALMDWIGGGAESAASGHDVVMTPTKYCYFDYYQVHEPGGGAEGHRRIFAAERVFISSTRCRKNSRRNFKRTFSAARPICGRNTFPICARWNT